MAEAPGPECVWGGVILSAVNCAADSKINVSAKIPGEIVVDFGGEAGNVELIDQTTGEPSPGEIVTCASHRSLHRALRVTVHSTNTDEDFYLKHDTDMLPYYVLIHRDAPTLQRDPNVGADAQPGVPVDLPAVADGGRDSFSIYFAMDPDDAVNLQPNVTYEDTLTVDVAYP